jgi:hypothetical protein
MNDLLILSALAALGFMAACALSLRWIRTVRRRRARLRRVQAYRLIHALRAYSAWVESCRDLPLNARSLDELTSPEPLTAARQIKREFFPSLAQYMVLLLQAHSRVIEYLWERNLLRLSQESAWQPAHQDAQYQQLRGAQEDLIDEMIAKCRELVGDTPQVWRRTGSDFSFGPSVSRGSQGPASGG